MAVRRRVYLVPGFFGFNALGEVSYFNRVTPTLRAKLRDRGVSAEVVECSTRPTASIRRRAERLIDDVVASGGADADELYFVGHSTGGLDARLLASPRVRLRADDVEERIGLRTRAIITIATPHHGTPLANFVISIGAPQLLGRAGELATSPNGREVIRRAARAFVIFARADDLVGLDETWLDWFATRILARLDTGSDDVFFRFIAEVAHDQGAIVQLTPESMNLFDAAVIDRDQVHYASLVTVAPPPRQLALRDLLAPARIARAGTFAMLYHLAGRERTPYPYPRCPIRPRSGSPAAIDARSNDGIVPTLSQVHGDVIDLVEGDHLDVVGQFRGAGGDRHADWLGSAAGFGEEQFQALWANVADDIAARC